MLRYLTIDRRSFLTAALKGSVCCVAYGAIFPVFSSQSQSNGELIEQWMNAVKKRAPTQSLNVSRFVERVWFLTKPIGWKPDHPDQTSYSAVNVPQGFVTDFASVPRVFWSLLPPDGNYIYPAIVHDYMYWNQERPREEADEIFRIGMEEFRVSRVERFAIYNAVKKFGAGAWEENAELKKQGEKRILAKFPEDPRTHWAEWKINPENFVAR